MAAAEKLSVIHRTRQANLKRVIKEKFEGNYSQAARAVDRSHTFMWQLLDGYRGIGEKSARHIEKYLELVPNSLDAAKLSRTVLVKTVPLLALDALDAKPKVFVPCTRIDCSAKTFAARVEDKDVAELEVGDFIFVDRADVELQRKMLYVVQPKGKRPCVLMSNMESGAWSFRATHGARRAALTAREVKVIGRVLLIVREVVKAS